MKNISARSLLLLMTLVIVGVASDQLITLYGLHLGSREVVTRDVNGNLIGRTWHFYESNQLVVRFWPWWIFIDWGLTAIALGTGYYIYMNRSGIYWEITLAGSLGGAGLIRLAAAIWNIYIIYYCL
jgi:hypothetical protein